MGETILMKRYRRQNNKKSDTEAGRDRGKGESEGREGHRDAKLYMSKQRTEEKE